MTHREMVLETLRKHGPLSDYGITHVARGLQMRMSPSSARTRRSELTNAGLVVAVGTEKTPTRTATVWAVKR